MLPTPLLLSVALLAAAATTVLSAAIPARDLAAIGISMYTGRDCTGNAATVSSVQYAHQNVGPQNPAYGSFGINRDLRPGEQLDFSARAGTDSCALFRVAFRGVQQGCYNVEDVNCFRLLESY